MWWWWEEGTLVFSIRGTVSEETEQQIDDERKKKLNFEIRQCEHAKKKKFNFLICLSSDDYWLSVAGTRGSVSAVFSTVSSDVAAGTAFCSSST